MNLIVLANGIAFDNRLKAITNDYRALPNGPKKKAFKLQNFENVTFSGIFTQRNNHSLDTYSGMMVLDLDDLQDVAETRQTLINQDAIDVVMMYVSPSGNGLKVVVPATTKDEHDQVFRMYQRFLKCEMGITVDPSGKDLARTSFICSDPDVYLNINYKFKKLENYWTMPSSAPSPFRSTTSHLQDVNYHSGRDFSPIHDFNVRGDIDAILINNGWSVYRKQNDKTHYTRPFKSTYEGPSGNVLHSINYFYVFTSSTCFEANRGYKASEVFAILECDGDILVANDHLRALGYGCQDEVGF